MTNIFNAINEFSVKVCESFFGEYLYVISQKYVIIYDVFRNQKIFVSSYQTCLKPIKVHTENLAINICMADANIIPTIFNILISITNASIKNSIAVFYAIIVYKLFMYFSGQNYLAFFKYINDGKIQIKLQMYTGILICICRNKYKYICIVNLYRVCHYELHIFKFK